MHYLFFFADPTILDYIGAAVGAFIDTIGGAALIVNIIGCSFVLWHSRKLGAEILKMMR